ncbi:hypothetical protein OAK00_02420 [Pelagibacteraceae bacterium]|nr:hypothetical protein [Pelagibacteraceae bacterium]
MDLVLENLVLIVLIIVQSIFGIGLLLFGTPTFLILGYDFLNTLNFLLPISIVISFLQLISFKRPFKKIIYDYNLFCLPFLVLFLIIALNFKDVLNFKVYVAIVLIVSSILTLKKNTFFPLKKIILKYKKFILIFIGSVHGLTNMGGGFLSIFSSLINNKDKNYTRHFISYSYLAMGVLQYIILLFLEYKNLSFSKIYYVLLVLIVYLPSQKLFKKFNNILFSKIISIIALFYGSVILISNFYIY